MAAAESPGATTKFILMLMVRNESKIIERCLHATLPVVDAVSVLDTGSTDGTVALVREVLAASGKPGQVAEEPFLDFGRSRTRSFELTQAFCAFLKWDPEHTYALAVDADMVLVAGPTFREQLLTVNGYHVMQCNSSLKYYNTRLMKCAHPWRCVGATHEYWSGGPVEKIPYDVLHIDDRNDGGCKSDKFERDVRLLTAEIAADPSNVRAHFYLGQSLKDLGRPDEAIPMFKRRIQMGGWIEEVWHAHYQLGKCYEHKGDVLQMERWMVKAYEKYPRRAETLYFLCKYFRERAQHYKAYHYYLKGRHIPYPTDDLLFVEHDVYNGLFEYENTILACYVHSKSRLDAAVDLVRYLVKGTPFHVGNVWDNLHYYVEELESATYRGAHARLLFPTLDNGQYHVSSCCVTPYSSSEPSRRYVLNTRYVNYTIDGAGAYHMPDGVVRTKNGRVFLNSSFLPTGPVEEMKELYSRHPSYIEGLEDVRVFSTAAAAGGDDAAFQFTASSKNATPDGRIVIVLGKWDPVAKVMDGVRPIEPPRDPACQKNWLFVPEDALESPLAKQRVNMIYGWSPLEIGAVNPDTNHLEIHTTFETPGFFSRLRGSAMPVRYGGKLWAVVHYVRYTTPRVYYHCVVQLNAGTCRPEAITAPFCFRRKAIEYCLGFHVTDDGTATFFFSENDTDPGMLRLPLGWLRWISL